MRHAVTHFTRRPAELLFLVGENHLLTHKPLPTCFNRHSIIVHVGAAHLHSKPILDFDTKLELRVRHKAISLVTRPAIPGRRSGDKQGIFLATSRYSSQISIFTPSECCRTRRCFTSFAAFSGAILASIGLQCKGKEQVDELKVDTRSSADISSSFTFSFPVNEYTTAE